MSETTVIAAPASGGNGTETPPLATEPSTTPTGADAQPQTPETPKVEGVTQPQATTPSPRPKVSEFYQQRDKTRRLEAEIKSLKDALTKLSEKPPTPVEAKPVKTRDELVNEFYKDPLGYHEKAIAELRNELAAAKQELLEKGVPEILSQRELEREHKQKVEDVLEILFPKGNSTLSLNERITANQERANGIMEIMESSGINLVKNPKKAAETILKLYDLETKSKPPNPNIPKKAQMASTASGVPAGGGQGGKGMEGDITALRAEGEKLKLQLGEKPELRFDEKFMERYRHVINAMGNAINGK